MKIVSPKTLLEVLSGILINLTSAWFGLLMVAPGFFGTSSKDQYVQLLQINLPLGILGLVATLLVSERSKKV